MSPLDRPLAVTIFPNFAASSKRDETTSLRDLEPRIMTTAGPAKGQLPWIKLARFGDLRKHSDVTPEDRQSLRHNANMQAVSGVEGDYDGGALTVDEAVDILRQSGIAGMIYTSPSHSEDAPRWRVLCPLSRDVAPDDRAEYVAWLNGAFQGALAGESFTASQAYYFGSVRGNPSHRVELVDGDFLDLIDGLAPTKIGKPKVAAPPTAMAALPRSRNNDAYYEAIIRNALGKVSNASDGEKHTTLRSQSLTLGGYSRSGGFTPSDAVGWLMNALPATVKDRKAAEVTARWGVEQGMARPLQAPTPRPEHPVAIYEPDDHDLVEVTGNVVNLRPARKAKPARPERPEGWRGGWHISDKGEPIPNLFNAMVTLRGHNQLSRIVRFDEMSRTPMLVDQIPGTEHDRTLPRPLRDQDITAIQEAIQDIGIRRMAKATVQDAVESRAQEDKYHPVKDYLNGLKWDGETRVDGWLSRYLGVEGCPYSDKIGRLFLIALVARIMKPGCKADYMLILEGKQGAMKSTACRVLAGGEWFSDNLPDLSHSDSVRLSMHLRGKWLIEIGELASFNSAESHRLKEFLTQTEERYTPKYGRNEVYEPRQCLFIGSTNEGAYLRDATGARRFWPVTVGDIRIEELAADRDQLFAEAVHLFRSNEKWWPEREFEAEHIAPQQAARFEADPWQQIIADWMEREGVSRCTSADVLRGAVGMSADRITKKEATRVKEILLGMKWQAKRIAGINTFFRQPPYTSESGNYYERT